MTVPYAGVDYRVEPLFSYELYGLVVSYRQHDGESSMHRWSNDHLNMADVCVVWSDTAFSPTLRKLEVLERHLHLQRADARQRGVVAVQDEPALEQPLDLGRRVHP